RGDRARAPPPGDRTRRPLVGQLARVGDELAPAGPQLPPSATDPLHAPGVRCATSRAGRHVARGDGHTVDRVVAAMVEEVAFFIRSAIYGSAVGAVYWFLTYEDAGSILLVGMGLATVVVALVLWFGLDRRWRS